MNFSPVSLVWNPPGSSFRMAIVAYCSGLDRHRSMKLVCFRYPNIQYIGNIINNNVQDTTEHCKAAISLAEVFFLSDHLPRKGGGWVQGYPGPGAF